MVAQEPFPFSSMHQIPHTILPSTNYHQLARAGLFYHPTSSSPDNTTCYLCQRSLDGWEEDDDAVVEHLKHAPECGWAVTIAIEQDVENGSYSLEDPMSEKVLNARRMTFGSNWPHEHKKGWACKTNKVCFLCFSGGGLSLIVSKDD